MTTARLAGVDPKTAPDELIRGPLWDWTPDQIPAVKHQRRRRFKLDSDDDGLPPVLDE